MLPDMPIIPSSPEIEFIPGELRRSSRPASSKSAARNTCATPRGASFPSSLVKPADKLEDEMVRKVFAFALDLSAQIARFKDHTYADLNGFQQLHEQDYGSRAGGAKGNVTFQTVDGLMQIKLQVADVIEFGSQLQQAKALIDECLLEWGSDARPEIRAVITSAFSVEKEGQINKANLFLLLKLDIGDERWTRAMTAIRDAIRVTGTKEYVRFYQRRRPQDRFETVTIDLAAA
jgi:hypothetical protein